MGRPACCSALNRARKESGRSLARVVASGVAGVDPAYMGIGPVEAVPRALAECRPLVEQIDLVELNEAFASQVLASARELGIEEERRTSTAARCPGHPLGCSGARLTGDPRPRAAPPRRQIRRRDAVRRGRPRPGDRLRSGLNAHLGCSPWRFRGKRRLPALLGAASCALAHCVPAGASAAVSAQASIVGGSLAAISNSPGSLYIEVGNCSIVAGLPPTIDAWALSADEAPAGTQKRQRHQARRRESPASSLPLHHRRQHPS